MRKKICIIGPAYPFRGGNALFVAHLYEALSKEFDVTVINFSKLYPKLLFPGSRQEDVSKTGVKVHPSEQIIDSTNPITWRKAVNRIKEINPDLIAVIWYQPYFGLSVGSITKSLRKYFHGRILFIAENIVSHEGRFYDLILTKRALRNADKFLVLSDIVEKGIKKFYPNKQILKSSLPIYDCYKFDKTITKELVREKLQISLDKKVLLFFGYIRAYKGLMNLINAMPILLNQDEKYYLLIVGEFYEDKEKYFNKIQELGIENNVKVISEFVPNEEVGIYYTASDLVVLPYNSATQSGILNIAYGFNRPVVVTNVGGLPELVEEGKTGFIVEPNNPDALAKGITNYFATEEKSTFEINIKKFVEKNSFGKIVDLFKKVTD